MAFDPTVRNAQELQGKLDELVGLLLAGTMNPATAAAFGVLLPARYEAARQAKFEQMNPSVHGHRDDVQAP